MNSLIEIIDPFIYRPETDRAARSPRIQRDDNIDLNETNPICTKGIGRKRKKNLHEASTPDVLSGGPTWSGLYGPVSWHDICTWPEAKCSAMHTIVGGPSRVPPPPAAADAGTAMNVPVSSASTKALQRET